MISFRIAGRVFTPRLWPTVMTVLMLAVLLGLGTWQVQRLHWKENLIATIDQRMHQMPVSAASLADDLARGKDVNYRPGLAIGFLQNDSSFYLFAISQTGEGGYHILTPMQMGNGKYLLVDRGWIPYDRKPGTGGGDFSRPTGLVTFKGILREPEHFWTQPPNKPKENNWFSIDLPAMAEAANVPAFLPYVLEADATPNQGGYPIGGQTRVTLPNNHFVYAVIWYSLALVLLVIYGLSSVQKKPVHRKTAANSTKPKTKA